MLKQFLVNLSLLITMLFLASQVIRTGRFRRVAQQHRPLLQGIAFGITSVILMMYSIPVSKHTIVDLSYVTVILATIYGGPSSVVITALIIIAGRMALFPVTSSTVFGIGAMMLCAIGCIPLAKRHDSVWRRCTWMAVYCLSVGSLMLMMDVHNLSTLWPVFAFSWPIILIGTWVSVYITELLIRNAKTQAQFEWLATTDHLTGLDNVRRFNETLHQKVTSSAADGSPLSLLIIDVDHFKRVNDTHGHASGDAVLKQLATILKQETRAGDTVARNGGEEFSMILPGCTLDVAMLIGERVRSVVEQTPFELPNGRVISVTVSIGVSVYPDAAPFTVRLLQDADDGLYQAKKGGRNRVCKGPGIPSAAS